MKVRFKHLINGYSGVVDDLVIYYSKSTNGSIIRRRPAPHPNQQTDKMKAVFVNLWNILPSDAYVSDFKQYTILYKQLRQKNRTSCVTWNNLWMKMLFMLQDISGGEVNLLTITRAQIYNDNLPCISVRAAVEAGLLPKVSGYELYNNLI